MRKKIFLLTSILCLLLNSFDGNGQSYLWSQRFGNTKSDKGIAIKTDSSGYVYLSGYFSNTTTLGTNNLVLSYTANSSSKEAFLAKFDSTGYCHWAKSGGQYFDDRVLGMDVDEDGNSVIVGTFWQTSTGFNMSSLNITGQAFGGSDQCFVVKHDKFGNGLWGRFICSNSGDDQGLDVATDKQGNSYIVGFMTGNTLFCNGSTVTASNTNTGYQKHSYWISKINSAGVFQWAKCFGNLPFDTLHNKYIERDIAVCVDDSGGVYVTGGFDHTWPFGSTALSSSGGYDIFVMKYDSAGNFVWAKSGGSKKDDWANGICADNKGFIYITGEHRDSLLYDTLLVKNYDKRDVFVMKIDAKTGAGIWGKRAGNDLGSERGNDIVADDDCNVWVCGDIQDTAKFGDNIITPPGNSVQSFVAHITPDGKWKWALTGGGTDSNDRCNAIALGRNKQLYACGFFRQPATFGSTSFNSAGSSDGYFSRVADYNLDKCIILPTDIALNKIINVHGDTMYSCAVINDNKMKIEIKNNNNLAAYNIKAYIQLNSNAPIMEIVPGFIAAGDSMVYTYNYSPYILGFGTYNIKLWVSLLGDSINNNDTAAYTSTIIPTTVYNQPYAQNFDSTNNLPPYWDIDNPDNSNKWSIAQCVNIANQPSNAAKMLANSNNPYNLDILQSPIIYLTYTMLQAGLYFDVAYAGDGSDKLEVWISKDCGVNYEFAGYSKSGSVLSTSSGSGLGFTPNASNQWRREFVDLTQYIDKNVILQFRASQTTGGNIWIDNINVQENFSAALNFSQLNKTCFAAIYPNPAKSFFNLDFKTEQVSKAVLSLYDMKGGLQLQQNINISAGKSTHQIDIRSLAKGVYFVELMLNDSKQRTKLIID